MLPVTVAWLTLKLVLIAPARPVAAAVNCFPAPALLIWTLVKITVPLPAPAPMSREPFPRSEPVPALTLSVTVLLVPSPLTESFPNESRLLRTGCGLRAEP